MTGATYSKKVYKDVPFKYVMRKKGYYNVEGFSISSESLLGINFIEYNGLSLSSEQITGSLMTVSITGGELPDKSYCETTLGCLATAGQTYSVETSGGVKTAIGLLPSGVSDDGAAKTYNLFYNEDTFLLDTVEKKNGYSWCGTISIPLHSV